MSTHKTSEVGQKATTGGTVKQSAANLAEQAKESLGSAAQGAAENVKTQADAAKASVAEEVSGVASALRTAANDMRSGSPQERTFGQIAEGLADASDAMRDKDLSTMVEEVSAFARKNPLVFLGGAALIGFAASRFGKASDKMQTPSSHATTRHEPTAGDMS